MALCNQIRDLIQEKKFIQFDDLLSQNIDEIINLKPRSLNEILLDFLKISLTNPSDCYDYIELFTYKLSLKKFHFLCPDETSKLIVNFYLENSLQLSSNSIYFLFRCYDLELLRKVFDSNIIDQISYTECDNWHLSFVASYQERFFSKCFENLFESCLARFILISKLRCSLKQKRSFLTWFAGSLHLYTDEYFYKYEQSRFRFVLFKLFESLILNGLLTNKELKNLLNMLEKRNDEIINNINSKSLRSSEKSSNFDLTENKTVLADCIQEYLPNLENMFPLSLKNSCRIIIKRSMKSYSKKSIKYLPLPIYLKKFIYFENECETVYECYQKS